MKRKCNGNVGQNNSQLVLVKNILIRSKQSGLDAYNYNIHTNELNFDHDLHSLFSQLSRIRTLRFKHFTIVPECKRNTEKISNVACSHASF